MRAASPDFVPYSSFLTCGGQDGIRTVLLEGSSRQSPDAVTLSELCKGQGAMYGIRRNIPTPPLDRFSWLNLCNVWSRSCLNVRPDPDVPTPMFPMFLNCCRVIGMIQRIRTLAFASDPDPLNNIECQQGYANCVAVFFAVSEARVEAV